MRLIGNTDINGQINIAIKSARAQNRSMPHMLLSGAAGCGKTSTARRIATDTNCKFINIACDSIKGRPDLLPIVRQFSTEGYDVYGRKKSVIYPTVLFIDEIHGLALSGQEHLGMLMEEWYILVKPHELTRKEAIHSTTGSPDIMPFSSPQFTLIGATTNDGKLSKPFRDRFKLRFVFSPYSFEESIEIVMVHAESLKIKIEQGALEEIAKRGRGVPRIIVSLLERCRDMVVAFPDDYNIITREMATVTFADLHIDDTGLTETDLKLLKILHGSKDAVGVDNLAVQLNESQKVLTETVEPYLIQRSLILRSSKGRKITDDGRKYLMDTGYIKVEETEKFIMPLTFDREL